MPDLFGPEDPAEAKRRDRLSPIAMGCKALLANVSVWATHQRLYGVLLEQAIRLPTSEAREEARNKFLALEALFEELRRMADNQVTEEDERYHELAVGRSPEPAETMANGGEPNP